MRKDEFSGRPRTPVRNGDLDAILHHAEPEQYGGAAMAQRCTPAAVHKRRPAPLCICQRPGMQHDDTRQDPLPAAALNVGAQDMTAQPVGKKLGYSGDIAVVRLHRGSIQRKQPTLPTPSTAMIVIGFRRRFAALSDHDHGVVRGGGADG
jgi:hypothetical protein